MENKKILVIVTIFMSFILALFVIEGLQKRDLQAGVDSETAQLLNEVSDTKSAMDSSIPSAGDTSETAIDSSGISSSEPQKSEADVSEKIAEDSVQEKKETTIRKVITENLFKRVELYSVSEQETYTQDNLTGPIKNGSAVKLDLHFEGGSVTYAKGDIFTTSFPEELGLSQDIEGTFSDESSKYTISATTGIVTVEFLRDTTDFKATLSITLNIPVYSETEDAIKKIHFESDEPTEFLFSIYVAYSDVHSYAYYDENEGIMSERRPYMPASLIQDRVTNQKGFDLSNGNMVLDIYAMTSSKPSLWTDGYVNVKRDSRNITIKEFTRNVKGQKTDTGTLLELNKDYTITNLTDSSFEIIFIGTEPVMGLIEYSYGRETFDYSAFNPAYSSTTAAASNSITFWSQYYIRKKSDRSKYVEYINSDNTIEVSPFIFLNYKTDKKHDYITNNEALELAGNTLYVNLSGEQLKKGKEIVLSLTDSKGNPNQGVATLYRKDLVKESDLKINGTSIIEKTKTSLKNWEIKDDQVTGTIILTYIGEDTTEAFGIEYFIRGSDADNNSYLNAVDKDKSHSAAKVYSQITPVKEYPSKPTEVSKGGVFNYNNKMVDWSLRVNRAYVPMEDVQLIDTPGNGNGQNISKMVLKTIPFVQTDTVKILNEGEDYNFRKNEDGSFKINFLKKFDEQLTVTYTQDLDYSELDEKVTSVSNKLALSYITDDEQKEAITEGTAQVPDYIRTNAPLVKLGSSGVNRRTNDIAIIINPAGQTDISNSEFNLDMDSRGLEISSGYRIYEMTGYAGTYNSITYNKAPLTEGDAVFPTITEKEGIITIKNADLDRPIVIFTSVRMNNYYLGGTTNSFSTRYSSSDYTGDVIVPAFSFGVWYDMTGSFAQNMTYDNVLDVNLTVPKKQGKLLKTKTRFTIQTNGDVDHQLYNSLIGAADDSGNLIPPSSYEIKSAVSDTTKYYYITLKEDLSNGLNMSIPLAYSTPGKKSLSLRSEYADSGPVYFSQTKDLAITATPLLDFIASDGEGNLQMTNLTIKKIDNLSKAPLEGAEFKLIDWSGVEVASGTTDSTGVLAISDVPTNKYHLVEIKAPEWYLISEEYTGEGKEINVVKSETNNQFIVENQATSKLNVVFSYEDGTPIKDIPLISLEGLAGEELDLTSKTEITAINESLQAQESSYLFKEFDIGQEATGTEDKLIMPIVSGTVYYKYQGLVQFSVSPNLIFESGLVLPFSQTLNYDNREDFMLSVKDNRQFTSINTSPIKELRGDFKVYATLTNNFKTPDGDLLVGAELSYGGSNSKIINQNAQLLYSNQHDANDAEKAEFLIKMDGTDTTDSGFKLLVPPGIAKKETYKAKIKWELVEAP